MMGPDRDSLLVMTRLPREGQTKTRLIPALGADGAAKFHDRLARHAVGRALSFSMMQPEVDVRVHLAGGTAREGREWLGEVECHQQVDGDLGERMQAAVDQAFDDGARRVVVIGTDCPDLDEGMFDEAFKALRNAELVYVPAEDGGYTLVGMSKPCAEVFKGIAWGGAEVLEQSLAAAKQAGREVGLLETLADVDEPQDLERAEAVLKSGSRVSVIIPTLNEERNLPTLLNTLKESPPYEIIVADGGSQDRTAVLAEQAGARVVEVVGKGRGAQMNAAAAQASGEFLLFLHADTLPPKNCTQVVRETLMQAGVSAGAFGFRLTDELALGPLIESLVKLRCRCLRTPYGDQGLFLRRRLFDHLGGFPEWPVMEDLHLVRLLGKLGEVRITEQAAETSSRRWQSGGTVRTFLRHQLMLLGYHLGLPIQTIARLR